MLWSVFCGIYRGPCVRKLFTGLIMYYPLKIKNIVLLYCIEQRIITLAYTAIVLVANAVEVFSLNSLKPDKRQTNEEPKSTKQTKTQPNKKTAESATKNLLKIKTIKRLFTKFPAICCSRKSLGQSTHRASNILGRTVHHV